MMVAGRRKCDYMEGLRPSALRTTRERAKLSGKEFCKNRNVAASLIMLFPRLFAALILFWVPESNLRVENPWGERYATRGGGAHKAQARGQSFGTRRLRKSTLGNPRELQLKSIAMIKSWLQEITSSEHTRVGMAVYRVCPALRDNLRYKIHILAFNG